MTMSYIRKTYAVPAKRGGRVSYKPDNFPARMGTICSANGNYLRIKLDYSKAIRSYHPTWSIEYLSAKPTPSTGREST